MYGDQPDAEKCPVNIQESLTRYIEQRIPCGGFLTSVLENDLTGAFARADANNLSCIHHIASYIYNFTPSSCHGSPEKVKAWLEQKGE